MPLLLYVKNMKQTRLSKNALKVQKHFDKKQEEVLRSIKFYRIIP